MLFDTNSSLTAESSLDALWLKTQVIANNMANADTPGFKASKVTFEESLRSAREARGGGDGGDGGDRGGTRGIKSGERASYGARGGKYVANVKSDPDTSARIDENNVSLEYEQAELWKTYAQYSYLMDRVSGHYRNINNAISSMRG